MVCRLWRGWTTAGNAEAYDHYLKHELFPRVEVELGQKGYSGYQLLRLSQGSEVEFVTMLWFESLQAVRGFAGEAYETPVISAKAKGLLAHYQERCDHYELSGSTMTGPLTTML